TAMPVKPNTAAKSATTKNVKAQLSIRSPFELDRSFSGSYLLRDQIYPPFSATRLQSYSRRPPGPQEPDANGGLGESLLASDFFGGHAVHLCFQQEAIGRAAGAQNTRHVDGRQILGGFRFRVLLHLVVQTLAPNHTPVLIE